MYFLFLLPSMLVAYLAGSINFAILISRWARGMDIRQAGNRNPGTSNVGRVLGKGWAALVLAGDLAKGLVPLILSRVFLFPDENYQAYFALFLTGMAAITGHCWPVYHGFKGGGGLATSIGIFMFFVPVEFFTALLISFLAVQIFFRGKTFPVGQITPMLFIPLAPILVLISSSMPEMPMVGTLSLGGHPWYVVAGIFTMSVYIFFVNIRIVQGRFSKSDPQETLR
jgi:glycerol-3-phosphate acyltransferase PlsY